VSVVIAIIGVAGTLVSMGALRSIREDPVRYGSRWIVGSMVSAGLVAVACGFFALVGLYVGVAEAVAGWPAGAVASNLAFGGMLALLGAVCVATLRDMGKCRKAARS
jgi:hypothetical protein